ncbi:MAG TPA: hypothetical protein VF666_18870 [Pyrinomonadaceae bacterium]|jgi:hypothetical protein
MLSRRNLFVGLSILMLVLVAVFSASTQAQKKQVQVVRPPSNPPTVTLRADTSTVTICPGETAIVKLNATAISPENRSVTYRWRATGGRIEGEGANTTWDLSGLRTGVYVATVEVDTGVPGDVCTAFTSVPIAINECPPPRVVCPNIVIYCPDTVSANQPITFSVELSGGAENITPVLNWKVSAGTIQSGQGTSTITVDTAGIAGQPITATVDVAGYNLTCTATCTVQIPDVPVTDVFDAYRDISYNNEKARLDNFVIWLQNHPGARGFIFAYQGRRTVAGRARARANRARNYIVNERGIEAGRIVIMEGPRRDEFAMELRGVPPGAAEPRPTP